MGFSCGIIGLPNVGKSTLFNALTLSHVPTDKYPFTTINPNVGVVEVPDERLKVLEKLGAVSVTPTTLKFVDIAGLVKGASKGAGLGNEFLSHVRNVDALLHVVRCFKDTSIPHVEKELHPKHDIEVVNLELIFKDLEGIEKRIESLRRKMKGAKKGEAEKEMELLLNLKHHLEEGKLARLMKIENTPQSYDLLTGKPLLYVANIDEGSIGEKNELIEEVFECAKRDDAEVVVISAKIEKEIGEFPKDEASVFREEFGLKESGLERLIKAGYRMLSLITFFTMERGKLQAWTTKRGTTAKECAGLIHSDMEKGFIAAEIIPFFTLQNLNGIQEARERGFIRTEGRNYIMQDGDVVCFKFNV